MLEQWGLSLPEASAHAVRVDWLFEGFGLLALALTAPVFILILAFCIRYRRGKNVNRNHPPDRNVWLEVSWSVLPFFLILAFFVAAARMFVSLHQPPAEAMPISVIAKQWMWKVEHPGGQREINELHVPVGEPVVLTMISQDVIHSFFVPAFRVKQDVLPGRYTTLWFTATEPGSYHLLCAEFCGADHSTMGGQVVVMAPRDYQRWLERADTDGSIADQGKRVFVRLGCTACHAAAAGRLAPSLVGIANRPVALAGGGSTIADDQYLHDSIVQPNKQIAAGYRPIMPSYARLASESEVLALVQYIKTLGRVPEGTR